jgi:acetolactate synthase-1/2/3 large subunit
MPEPAMRTVAEILARSGCRAVFGLPADEAGLLDAADADARLLAVPVPDQRAAACAAAGYALTARAPAVLALATGPAFVNALPGLLEAASLGAPLVVITTRVPADDIGRGAFQHVDQAGMAASLVKWYALADTPDRLVWAVRRAVWLSVNGRPGVTLVEVACAEGPAGDPGRPVTHRPVSLPDARELDLAASMLAGAAFPLVLAGGGLRWSPRPEGAVAVAEALAAPILTTAAGRGLVDERHPLAVGCAGLYATPPIDALIDRADVVLALGSRLEETVRLGWPGLTRARLIHVDLDPYAFDAGVQPALPLLGDAGAAAAEIARLVNEAGGGIDGPRGDAAGANAGAARTGAGAAGARGRRRWEIGAARGAAARAVADGAERSPVRTALAAVAAAYGDDVGWVQENGLHDMWSYHHPALVVTGRAGVVCPGEQTMLGFGVAASLGAAVANPDRPVVALAGDSAVRMSLNILPTLQERRLGVTIVMFDNGGFGWPRWMRRTEGHPDQLTRTDAPLPVVDLVRAGGGWATTADDIPAALRQARDAAAEGNLALVRIPVPDDDVPPGVLRLFPR